MLSSDSESIIMISFSECVCLCSESSKLIINSSAFKVGMITLVVCCLLFVVCCLLFVVCCESYIIIHNCNLSNKNFSRPHNKTGKK